MGFPKDFAWGVAAASYQVEGAAREDGKGLSVWDMVSRQPGKVFDAHNGDIACDHYHRYQEDVDIMREMGVQAYRLSVSWPRVMPDGVGRVNEKGLAFYDRLIDSLLAAHIDPWVTLFHWDYPHELFCKGGWLNPDSSDWFADYARVIVERLSDRVSHWMTLNEPQCFIGLGHFQGDHAPRLNLGIEEVLRAGHNVLLSHGKAVQVIRAASKQPAIIGFAPVGSAKIPATNSDADIAAARQAMFEARFPFIWANSWWSDAAILGRYPEDGMKAAGHLFSVRDGDMETIAQPVDFYGTNIYNAETWRMSENGQPEKVVRELGYPHTAYDWPVTDDALYWGARFFHERYKLPIAITENGLASMDWVALDGKVHDPGRIDFLQRYLRGFKRVAEEGIPTLGYFQWSILDNFEWAQGYKQRFGLVHVDFNTQKRTVKDSGRWYGEVIRSNGENL